MGAIPGTGLLIAAGGVLVLAVAAATVAALRPAGDLDPGGPPGVVQGFLDAMVAGDRDTVLELIDPDEGCDVEDLRNTQMPQEVRVVLVSTESGDDVATVTVQVSESSGEDLFGSGWKHRETYRMTDVDGSWRITMPAWPLYLCSAGR